MASESSQGTAAERLLEAIIELSHARELEGVMSVVRRRARELTGADGVTFVLREGDRVFYADEDAVGPLWKGQRFQASSCISGWSIEHRQTVVIEDIYLDGRIPHDAYRPTFVKSLAMTPIRVLDPVGAIGAYWATAHRATRTELSVLEALASASAVAIHNAELLADAQRAARVREDFLTIASHEIRTPLSSMLLSLAGLERALRGTAPLDRDKMLERVATIARGGRRMNELVEHLLGATRMMRGQVVLVQARFDLAALVRRQVAELAETALKAGCELRMQVPGALFIEGDEERLNVALSNLLSNAIKYGASHPIDVALEASDFGARISVRDRGIGIAPNDHARIFDPFERAVSTRNYGGFGVGLWAARKMVEAHGGRIEVTSELGKGALFTLDLVGRVDEPLREGLH